MSKNETVRPRIREISPTSMYGEVYGGILMNLAVTLHSFQIVIGCRLSVERVYCDKTTANRITGFHHKAAKGLNC